MSGRKHVKIKRVHSAMRRVYSLGRFKTLHYEVLAEGEVQSDQDASAAVDELTEFLDHKVARFASDRDLDHLMVSSDDAPFDENEFDEDDDDEEE